MFARYFNTDPTGHAGLGAKVSVGNDWLVVKNSSPLLIVSGTKDEVVPHLHSKLLFNKANNPKTSLFIDEAMHNNLYDFGIEKTVINFSLKIWKLI